MPWKFRLYNGRTLRDQICKGLKTALQMAASKEVQTKEVDSYFKVTRIYSDQNGESHFSTVRIKMKDKGDIGSISDTIPSCSIMFRETPSSYNYSWHNAPRRQFIVNLDASVQITVSSGEIRTLGEGEVMFVEDTHGKGHLSESVDSKVRHSLFLAVPDDYKLPGTE